MPRTPFETIRIRGRTGRLLIAALILAVVCAGSGCLLPTIESQTAIPSVNTLTIFGGNPLTLDPAIS